MKIAREVALYKQGSVENGIDDASKVATSFITYVSQAEGIKVHNADDLNDYVQVNSNHIAMYRDNVEKVELTDEALRLGDTTDNATIDDSGMEITQGGQSVAMFGADLVRVGNETSGHTNIQPSGMQIYGNDGTVELANIGYGSGNAESGTADAPYYTFGTRMSGSSVGNYSVAEGRDAIASGAWSHAEGGSMIYNDVRYVPTASGPGSHAEGYGSTASGAGAHAEGDLTVASGGASHAEGDRTTASGGYAHAEGSRTVASGADAHADGGGTVASAYESYAGGLGTIASKYVQRAVGRFNVEDTSGSQTTFGDYAVVVGNGSSENARSNAMAVGWDGNLRVNGDTYIECNANSSGGTLLKVLKVTKASVSSLPATINNANYDGITAKMEVLHSVLSNPSAQTGDWTVETYDGYLIVSGSISGTTNITLYLAEPSTI